MTITYTSEEGDVAMMNTLDNLPVTKNIAKIMREDGLNEKKVAKRAGYSEQEFKDMIGGNRIITVFDITKLCMVLGVCENMLFK